MITAIDQDNFKKEVLQSDIPVVVDFWAQWCGPCKMLSPVIEEVSNELGVKAKFVKVNVDENPVLSPEYSISSIPSVLVFKNGIVVEKLVGFRPKQEIAAMIQKHI
jgi:thioredoxin 1